MNRKVIIVSAIIIAGLVLIILGITLTTSGLLNCEFKDNPTTNSAVKISDIDIETADDNQMITPIYLKQDVMKAYFYNFIYALSRSSVKFDIDEFFEEGFAISELRKVDYTGKTISGYENETGFYYQKYISDKNDIVFIVFNDNLDPLQIIDCNDTLFSEKEKKQNNYLNNKSNLSFKKIILDIDLNS